MTKPKAHIFKITKEKFLEDGYDSCDSDIEIEESIESSTGDF